MCRSRSLTAEQAEAVFPALLLMNCVASSRAPTLSEPLMKEGQYGASFTGWL